MCSQSRPHAERGAITMPMVAGVMAMIVCGPLATHAMDDPQLDHVRDELESDADDDVVDDDDGGGDLGDVVAGIAGSVGLIQSIADAPVSLPAFASHPY